MTGETQRHQEEHHRPQYTGSQAADSPNPHADQAADAPPQPTSEFSEADRDTSTVGVIPSDAKPSLHYLKPCPTDGRLGMLDHYEIIEIIGRGGMGVVLRGYDPRLNREVAIKVLAPEMALNATARQRFLREAKAAAAVEHDHIVRVHGFGETEKIPYMVMQCIEGRSLEQTLIDEGPPNAQIIARIGIEIASGLAAAHANGLVHRDIKPGNILLEGDSERVKITDFGLARAVDDIHLTKSGVVCGTPQYMSPEQASGQQSIDHRSDLFSLGSVLYAMCTGQSPFRAETPVAAVRRVCDHTPHTIQEVNPNIPDWLVEIIDKLLAKNPARRFQSAADVIELLEQDRTHWRMPQTSESQAQPAARNPARRRFGGKRRTVTVLASSVFLLFIGLGVAELAGWTNLLRSPPTVDRHPNKKEIAADTAQDFDGSLTAGDPIDYARPKHGSFYKAHSIHLRAGENYLIDMQGDFDTLLRVEDGNKQTLMSNDDFKPGQIADSRLIFTPGVDGQYRLIATSFLKATEGAYSIRAAPIKKVGKPRVIEGKPSATKSNPKVLSNQHVISLNANTPYTIEVASEYLDSQLRLIDLADNFQMSGARIYRMGKPGLICINYTPMIDGKYSLVFTSKDDVPKGSYQLTIQQYEQAKLRDGKFWRLMTEARQLATKKQWAKSATAFTQAIALRPNYSPAYVWRGFICYRSGDFSKTAADYRKILPTLRGSLGEKSIAYSNALTYLATALLKLKKPAKAEVYARESCTILKQKMPDSWVYSNAQSLLGGSLADQKKYAEAEPLLAAGYEGILSTVSSKTMVHLELAFGRLKKLYESQGDTEKLKRIRAKHQTRYNSFIRDWLVVSQPLPAGVRPSRPIIGTQPGIASAEQMAAWTRIGKKALAIEQIPGEALLRPKEGDPVAGPNGAVWKTFRTEDGVINLAKFFARSADYSVAYAVCYLTSDADRDDLTVKLGSDDLAKVYLNGRQVHEAAKPRNLLIDEDHISGISLKKGTNVLVFKIVNITGAWGGCVRLVDKNGSAVSGVQVRLTP